MALGVADQRFGDYKYVATSSSAVLVVVSDYLPGFGWNRSSFLGNQLLGRFIHADKRIQRITGLFISVDYLLHMNHKSTIVERRYPLIGFEIVGLF